MLNSQPKNKNYHQGNFIPKDKEKVLKLNSQGGIYYRSSWELKIMTWLDGSSSVTKWGAECMAIPYQMTHFNDGDIKVKNHSYYPDFYYEMKLSDGSIKKVVAEVKPQKEYQMALMLQEKKIQVPDNKVSLKKLKSFEYDLKMAQKNLSKWETMIEFCSKKGWEFIVITEIHLKRFNL
jgi:hypothetical protein